jgi:ankyrin repeat protein
MTVAAQEGHIEILDLLVKKCGMPRPQSTGYRKRSVVYHHPLHAAASKGRVEVMKWLVEVKREHVDLVDHTFQTPLHHAATNGSVEAVIELVRVGASVEAVDGKEQTPLHNAALQGNVEVVEELVSLGANLNAITKDGSTVLHCAANQ